MTSFTPPGPTTGDGSLDGGSPSLACVVLAHDDPVQVHRLIEALDPFPVFLHCDVRTRPAVHAAMTAGLPDRCTLLPRIRTGWARWENVQAELDGYRAALAGTDATHVAVLTGTDYPLASTSRIRDFLAEHRGRSVALQRPMPLPAWGRSGGLARLRYPHRAWRKHMLRLPVPRRLPAGVVPAGGSQVKVLARRHAAAVLDVADRRPDLVRFWRRSWIADETFVASVLLSPELVPDWQGAHVPRDLWWIDWGDDGIKSPAWLDGSHHDLLVAAAVAEQPQLFARKFSSVGSAELLDRLDAAVRAGAGP